MRLSLAEREEISLGLGGDDARSGDFLGQGAIVAVPGSDRGFEIGFQLSKKAWGRGVGTRLSRFLCGFAVVWVPECAGVWGCGCACAQAGAGAGAAGTGVGAGAAVGAGVDAVVGAGEGAGAVSSN